MQTPQPVESCHTYFCTQSLRRKGPMKRLPCHWVDDQALHLKSFAMQYTTAASPHCKQVLAEHSPESLYEGLYDTSPPTCLHCYETAFSPRHPQSRTFQTICSRQCWDHRMNEHGVAEDLGCRIYLLE